MQRIKFLLIGVISLAFIFDAANAQAQTNFDTFWTNFKTAVVKKDKSAVANLSKLPLSMPYGVKNIKTKSEFLRRYNEIFYGEADAAKCFANASAQIVSAKRREIACGFKKDTTGDAGEPLIYAFELTKSSWKFVSFDNINE